MTQVQGRAAATARLMDAAAVERCVRRLAHEVAERHPGLEGVVVAGIREGGVPVARRLVAALADLAGVAPPLLALDVSAHRDDRPRRGRPGDTAAVGLAPEGVSPAIDGAVVVLVDDVVHTGRTLRAALDCLADLGRPAAVEALVLVDRGRRELPLRATYVGRNVPAPAETWVEVVAGGAAEASRGAWLLERRP